MNLNLQPTLKNELIILRPLRENDFEPLYQVAKDPLIWEQHPSNDRYQINVYTKFFNESIESKGSLVIIDKKSNEVIGSTRFKRIIGVPSAVEIGWSFLSRKNWGGKYNKVVKKLMLDYAFQSIEGVVFYIGKKNIRSQKAIEKLGGVRIPESKFQHLIKKSETDYTYCINNKDWKNL